MIINLKLEGASVDNLFNELNDNTIHLNSKLAITAFNSTFFLDSLICNKNDAKYNGGAISIIW